MKDEKNIILACDVGNTHATFAIFEGERLRGTATLETARMDASSPEAARLLSSLPRPTAAAIASVAPSATEAAMRLAGSAGVERIFDLDALKSNLMPHQLSTIETTGIDRLLSALAAYGIAQGAAVVADCGTAATVDVVDAGGVFLGGAILPGAQLMLDSLSARAQKIPRVEFAGADISPLGSGTRKALLAGAAYGLAGGIDRLAREFAALLGGKPKLFLTGGGAGQVAPYLESGFALEPHLVLRGARIACEKLLGG